LPSNDSFTTIWSTLEKPLLLILEKYTTMKWKLTSYLLIAIGLAGYSQKKEDLELI
jgi:hypothetical protein